MLDSLLVKNFRLFKELKIPELRRVNLVVGRNNSGKSALLEAVELYASQASLKVLADLITKRQETWSAQIAGEKNDPNPLRHLFYGHQLPAVNERGIVIGPIQQADQQLKLHVGAYQLLEEEGVLRRVPTEQFMTPMLGDLPAVELSLIATENGKTRRLLELNRNPLEAATLYRKTTNLLPTEPKMITQIVPARNMTEEKLAELWDAINLTGLDEEVIAGLQLLERNIIGIAFVEDRVLRGSRLPIVRMSHSTEPLPLKSMGDGILRLFHITIALVNARNGIVLIDEIENGLHWSVQAKVWEMIFQLAEKLNVQVFASTHSRDCIKGFEAVWQKYEALGCFFRLNSVATRSTTVTMYSCETLSDALETDVEVR